MKPGKYTAKQITDLAGFEDVKFGKDRVRIAGIQGIVEEDKGIRIQPKGEPVVVSVNQDSKTLEIE